jgi:hypothetical protein
LAIQLHCEASTFENMSSWTTDITGSCGDSGSLIVCYIEVVLLIQLALVPRSSSTISTKTNAFFFLR